MSIIDLDAYFERIGYSGEGDPTLDTLRQIQLLHTKSIAFENINPFLGLPVRLDPASLERKLVRDRRGGYCYEHNLLLKHVLDGLGYKVAGLAARVLWNLPPGSITACTHMLLRVDLTGQAYIVDAGFGGPVPTGPLRLEPDTVQETPHGPSRLVLSSGEFILQSYIGNKWRPLYRFDLKERFQVDYEVFNYYLSTSPNSPFVTDLLVAKPGSNCRSTLHTNCLIGRQVDIGPERTCLATSAEHCIDGGSRRRDFTTVGDIIQSLEDVFNLSLPISMDLEAKLQKRQRASVAPAAGLVFGGAPKHPEMQS